MKTIKLTLEPEDDQDIYLGLIRLSAPLPAHELFYKINLLNHPDFKRIEDLVIEGKYFRNHFPRYRTYSATLKTEIDFLQNHSSQITELQPLTELFAEDHEQNLLLPDQPDVDYIIKASDSFDEFSLILLPQEFTFPVQKIKLTSEDRLFTLFQYYE